MSNYLPAQKQALAVAMLCEGMGLRPVGRVLECQYETIMKLQREVGEGYARLHDKLVVDVAPEKVELDEAWSFVFKKQSRVNADDPKDYGDQYSFIAMDPKSKAIVAYHVGKRTKANTIGFALDLAARMKAGHAPLISADGFSSYPDAIMAAFGPDVDFGVLIKEYRAACSTEAAARYTPAEVKVIDRKVVSGDIDEDEINTAYVERQNLTLRMLTRRFNRLTNAHSKTLRNHRAAFDLYVGYYNFCWVHETLKATPAMALGIADKRWPVDKLVDECRWRASEYDPPKRPGEEHYAEWLRQRQRERQQRGRR